MTDEEQKNIWKAEAEQQRKDNLLKQKVVKRREVEIKFGGVKKKNPTSPPSHTSVKKSPESHQFDDWSRQALGL